MKIVKNKNVNKKFIFNKILIIIAITIILFTLNNYYNHNSKNIISNNYDNYSNIDVESLIGEENNLNYDRNDYTSTYQNYSCYNHYPSHKYDSIRKYNFYESKWYNGEYYIDPYTNNKIYDISEVDYDHIIPLHYVNQHGGANWTEEQKRNFADDPEVGVCTNKSDNRTKSDKGPSEWLPKENKEQYCYSWLVIAEKYNLTISQDDMDVILNILDGISLDNISFMSEY